MKILKYLFLLFLLVPASWSQTQQVIKTNFNYAGNDASQGDESGDIETIKYQNIDLNKKAGEIFGISLFKGFELKTIIKKISPAESFSTGDGAVSEHKIVYFKKGKRNVAIMFSEGEMGCIIRIFYPELFRSFVINPHSEFKKEGPVRFANGLTLGMTHKQVMGILGKPQKKVKDSKRDECFYGYSADITLEKTDPAYKVYDKQRADCFDGKEPFYHAGSLISIKFKNDKVVFIEVVRVESIC